MWKPEFQLYEKYSRIGIMKRHLCLSCSQDHCPDPKESFLSVHRGSKFMHSDESSMKISQNHSFNLDEVFLKLPPSSDFSLETTILQIG
eukprot:UN26192